MYFQSLLLSFSIFRLFIIGARDNDPDVDKDSSCSYHRAYLQAEIKPKTGHSNNNNGFSNATREFNIIITALVGGVWKLEEDPANYTCQI